MCLSENYRQVLENIRNAAKDAQRNPEEISLVAVSKTHDADKIIPLLNEGHRIFGENRVQEAQKKWPELKALYPDVKLHLIGGLQTNKAKEAVALFDVIESLDRPELAEKLAEEMKKQNRFLPCFVQVNTGEEPQKSGVSPKDAVSFVKLFQEKYSLNVIGLMCIPPVDDEPAPHFAFLKKLAKDAGVKELSMGMSDDLYNGNYTADGYYNDQGEFVPYAEASMAPVGSDETGG